MAAVHGPQQQGTPADAVETQKSLQPTSADTLNPPKRPMPAFLQNLMNANQNIICTAKGDDVKKKTVAEVFSQRLRIPIFQRRYCWGKDQWNTLLDDALSVASGKKPTHALGRITCVKNKSDGRVAVIDGQQRNTTCSLLMAAIRDVSERRPGDADCQRLADTLNDVLLPGKDDLAAWLASRNSSEVGAAATLEEGACLEFAALVPTYCDRAAYFAAVLPCRAGVSASGCEWQRPMEAKEFFMDRLDDLESETLVALADAVLNKLEWLFFPITIDDGYADGTEDVHIIFERLAARDATWCKPTRETEYASMGAADFVRNLLLGSFGKEADAIDMYKKHWLPIETAAAAASRRSRDSGIAPILEAMLEAFLRAQPEQTKAKAPPRLAPGLGGELYGRFRRWLVAALEADRSAALGESEAEALERKTALLLQRLQAFAEPHLENAEAHEAAGQSGGGGSGDFAAKGHMSGLPGLPEGGRPGALAKWRCSRCSFPNAAGMPICTACMQPRP